MLSCARVAGVAAAVAAALVWFVHRRSRPPARDGNAAEPTPDADAALTPDADAAPTPDADAAPTPPDADATSPPHVPVIHRDDGFIAVDKPSGLVVHHWSSMGDEPSLADVLRGWPEFAAGKVHLVHRLDRSTSGVLLVATTPQATSELAAVLETGSKVYVALCRGVASDTFRVDRPLRLRDAKASRGRKSGWRAKQAEARLQEGHVTQEATTDFVKVATCCDGHCSLLLCLPHTGRYHQIRRHLDGARHSVSGDVDYGPSGINSLLASAYGLNRIFLHAAKLLVEVRGRPLALEAPLPDSLRGPLGAMEGGAAALHALDATLAKLDGAWVADARARAAAGPRMTESYRKGIKYDPSQHARGPDRKREAWEKRVSKKS